MDLLRFNLPAAEIAPTLVRTLSEGGGPVVVTAPPGAGKSTLLPLAILDALPQGRILMLEPRRIAARQIAERMSSMLGESVGGTVGYRVRFESKVSSRTRLEVLTEGILTRMLVEDPTLEGVSTVIFDEFHERSLQSDVALALTRQSRQILREDLGIVIMSATIDAEDICRSLGAKHIESRGKMYPVEIANSCQEADESNAAELAAHQVRLSHRERQGDILVFLPGEGEIRRCAELLGDSLSPTRVFPLYGMLSPQEQRAAIAPSAPGERKVVLATPIAETSITIEGVRTVIDTGLYRKTEFNPQSGLDRLVTKRISLDMASQRAGRAGRVAPGTCIRLWSKATESRLAATRIPEILEADLASTVLDIAVWGGRCEDLPWLTTPPAFQLKRASELLTLLGALDEDGNATARGKALSKLPCHPRIANMLLSAGSPEKKALAADIAAVLEEKDPLAAEDSDICRRISALRAERGRGGNGRWNRIARIAQQYRDIVRVREDNSPVDPYEAGALIAAAYPERIAKEDGGRYILACGETASLQAGDVLEGCTWMAVASMSPREGSQGRIFLAAPVSTDDLAAFSRGRDTVAWDSRKGAVVARHEERIGALVLDSRPLSDVAREEIERVICENASVSMLDFNDDVQNLQRRVATVSAWHPELELPDLSTEAVLKRAAEWLPLYIGKATTEAELRKIDLCKALWGLLSFEQQQSVERIAPSHITVPTGSSIRLEYRTGAEFPVLKVRLQECFGMEDTPRVDGGRVKVLMELLSPGYKPVQLTQDLQSFWKDTYFEVRKELRRRYPKHSWPDDPLEAPAVRGVARKPRQ